MRTQSHLADELCRLGYPTTTRMLEEWRAKGWLPALEKGGLGRGKGSRNRLLDYERTLEQAAAVHWLLKQGARKEAIPLNLFFAGFDIAPEVARVSWLARLDKFAVQIPEAATKYDLENFLHKLAHNFARKNATQYGIVPFDLTAISFEFIGLFFDPDFEFDADSNYYLLAPLIVQKTKQFSGAHGSAPDISESGIATFAEFVKSAASLRSIRNVLERSTSQELSEAHALWLRVGIVVAGLMAQSGQGSDSAAIATRMIAIGLGAPAIIAILYLIKFDANRTLPRALDFLTSQPPQLASAAAEPPRGANSLSDSNSGHPDFLDILSGLNLAEISHKIGEFQAAMR